jgi:hypothetical protein
MAASNGSAKVRIQIVRYAANGSAGKSQQARIGELFFSRQRKSLQVDGSCQVGLI